MEVKLGVSYIGKEACCKSGKFKDYRRNLPLAAQEKIL